MLKNHSNNGAVLSLLSSILFATQYPLIKLGLNHVPTSLAAVLECIFTGLLCFISAWFLKHSIRIVFSKELVISGILNAAGLIALFEGLAAIHPGVLGLIGRLYFVYAMLISYLYFKEKPSVSEMLLVPLAILGVFLVSFQGGDFSVSSNFGMACAFLYPALFAMQNAVIKPVVQKLDASTVLLNTKLYALIPMLIYWWIRHHNSRDPISFVGIEIIFISTFFSTFLGLLLFYKALSLVTFRLASLVQATEPVFILIFSYLLFPVELTMTNRIGALLVLVSVGFVASKKQNS